MSDSTGEKKHYTKLLVDIQTDTYLKKNATPSGEDEKAQEAQAMLPQESISNSVPKRQMALFTQARKQTHPWPQYHMFLKEKIEEKKVWNKTSLIKNF